MLLRDWNPNIFVRQRQQDNQANLMNILAGQQNMQQQAELRAQVPGQRATADMTRAAQAAGYGPQKGAAQTRSMDAMRGAQANLPVQSQRDDAALKKRQLENERYSVDKDFELKGKMSDDKLLGDIISAVGGGAGFGAMGGMGGGNSELTNALINSRYPGMIKLPEQKSEADLAAVLSGVEGKSTQPRVPWEGGNPPILDVLNTMVGAGEYDKEMWNRRQTPPQYGPPAPQQQPMQQSVQQQPARPMGPQLGDAPAQYGPPTPSDVDVLQSHFGRMLDRTGISSLIEGYQANKPSARATQGQAPVEDEFMNWLRDLLGQNAQVVSQNTPNPVDPYLQAGRLASQTSSNGREALNTIRPAIGEEIYQGFGTIPNPDQPLVNAGMQASQTAQQLAEQLDITVEELDRLFYGLFRADKTQDPRTVVPSYRQERNY